MKKYSYVAVSLLKQFEVLTVKSQGGSALPLEIELGRDSPLHC